MDSTSVSRINEEKEKEDQDVLIAKALFASNIGEDSKDTHSDNDIDEEKILAQLEKLGLSKEEAKLNIESYKTQIKRRLENQAKNRSEKINKSKNEQDAIDYKIANMTKDKLDEWREKAKDTIRDMNSLKGKNGEAEQIVSCIISYYQPENNAPEADHIAHLFELFDVATWLVFQKKTGKSLMAYYKSVVGKRSVTEDGIVKFCEFCTSELKRNLMKDDVSVIMEKLFVGNITETTQVAFHDYRSNPEATLNDVNKLQLFLEDVTTMLSKYKSFSSHTDSTKRGYVLALCLLREENMSLLVKKYLKKGHNQVVTASELAEAALTVDSMTLGNWLDCMNPDRDEDKSKNVKQ